MKSILGNRWLLLGLLMLILSALAYQVWPQPRAAIYSLVREHGRAQTLADLDGYQHKSSDHFEVYFTDSDQRVVPMVLEAAEASYAPVARQVGYEVPSRIPIIIYASRDELRTAFGWSKNESALGVYFSGTIRLLSPNAWTSGKNERDQLRAFKRLNPIAHELTHYFLDYKTSGNYPRWFTEGLAQRVEYKLTDYLWIESSSSLRQPLYTIEELHDRFDSLSNQPLAYRESYLIIDYLARTYGEDRLSELLDLLGVGVEFGQAVDRTYGQPVSVIYQDWTHWVKSNVDWLEQETN